MMEPPKFGYIEPATIIRIDDELEQRVLGVKNARTILIDEKQEERSKRIETANFALEDFCTGLLCGLQILKAR
jgi:hypothetical protein